MKELTHYIPILTTLISAPFAFLIFKRYFADTTKLHLLWWGIGMALYGIGTLTEALTTLVGWNLFIFKAWFISGALLGAAPLAMGTVYLFLSKSTGHKLAITLGIIVLITSIFAILSPVDYDKVPQYFLSGKILVWQQVRLVSPFINGFAALFLIGGAIVSAMRYRKHTGTRNRFVGNLLIAIGAILPGIGGSFARFGVVEVLFVGEFIGVILIWTGFNYCTRETSRNL